MQTENTSKNPKKDDRHSSRVESFPEFVKQPEMKGRKVVVVGLGVSGMASARWLAEAGARVILSEVRPLDALDQEAVEAMLRAGVQMETGGHSERTFSEADLIVLSPGVPHDLPLLQKARASGTEIIGEMEMASRLLRTPIIAITGTNGKSTVTECMGELLQIAGKKPFVGGNLGTPLMTYAGSEQDADFVVAEVSSFQLDSMVSFHPRIAVILNITPDHLDRYPDFDAYTRSKYAIARNQQAGDHLVLNDEDPRLAVFDPPGPTVLRYGFDQKANRNAFVRANTVITRLPGQAEHCFPLAAFALPGRHNLENLMALILAALAIGIPPGPIQAAIHRFRPLPNRMEKVAEHQGVAFFNDSKATNIDAAVRAIESLEQTLILIAGGRHKGANYAPLVQAGQGRVKHAVFVGEARDILAADFSGKIPYSLCRTLEEAVHEAFLKAAPGDAVLLAPACSSFDMFTDYAHRGRVFRKAVEALRHG